MIDYNLCYTIPMIIKHTRDTLSETYLDAVAIRNTVFVKGQGVPRSIDIDANEAYCIHFVLYDDKGQATATVRLLPNIDLTQVTLQRMAVLDDYQGQGLGSILLKEAEDFAQEQGCYVGADARQSGTYQGELILETETQGDINGGPKEIISSPGQLAPIIPHSKPA